MNQILYFKRIDQQLAEINNEDGPKPFKIISITKNPRVKEITLLDSEISVATAKDVEPSTFKEFSEAMRQMIDITEARFNVFKADYLRTIKTKCNG